MGWGIVVRGALSTISEIIWEIVSSVDKGNFSLVKEKSENFKNLSGCSNHVLDNENTYLNVTYLIEYFKK